MVNGHTVSFISVRFKIIYTDYFRHAIVYICQSVDDRGICRQPSEQVLILGRNGKINDSERISPYGIVSKGICADMFDFVPAAREGYSLISTRFSQTFSISTTL